MSHDQKMPDTLRKDEMEKAINDTEELQSWQPMTCVLTNMSVFTVSVLKAKYDAIFNCNHFISIKVQFF